MRIPHDDSYWVIPTRLLAGAYPGALDEAGAKRKLQSILDVGVTAFIDLTEEGELQPYSNLLQSMPASDNTSIIHERLPIRDLSVPTESGMSVMLDRIITLLGIGEIVYVHCWGGIGRTGTVIGCYMVQEMGMTGSEAILSIEESRRGTRNSARRSPETQDQRDMVMKW